MTKLVVRVLFLVVASLAWVSRAAAEDPAPAPRAIEEIVVTAQKKAENIEQVPISITAVSGDFMKEAAIDDVADLVRYTPSVYFQENGPAGSAIFIRGFGTPFALSTLDPGVSLVLDELSIPRDVYLSDPLFDLERFEVLRGPQGTLFGKNTPAGLFNLTTKRPTKEFSGDITARIGGLDTHRFEAGVGGPVGPLGERLQFRVAAVDSDGIDDVVNTKIPGEKSNDTQQQAGRAELAFQPYDSLDALLIGSRAETRSVRNYSWQQRHLRQSSIDFLRQYDPKFEDDPFNHQLSQNSPGDTFRDTDLAQLNLHQQLPNLGPAKNLELTAILGWSKFDQGFKSDLDMTPADILSLPDAAFHYRQRSVELRLAGTLPAPRSFGTIDVLVGGMIFDSEYSSGTSVISGNDFTAWALSPAAFELITGSQPPGGAGFSSVQEFAGALGVTLLPTDPLAGDGFHIVASQNMSSKAVFGQLAWHPTEKWTASFGARANFEDKDADIVLDCFTPGIACAAAGGSDYTAHPKRSESDVSPKVGVQYFPWETLSLFATYAQGYKSGGFNNLALNPDGIEVEPEKTKSWEVGAKGRLFHDTLSYGLTLFNMDVDDLQLQNFISSTIVLVRNAASARSRGAELDFQWLTPWEPLSIRASAALADAKFKDYPDAPAPRGHGSSQDLSGKRLPYAPEQQLSATPEVRFPFTGPDLPFFGSRLLLVSALDVQYIGGLFLDGDLDPNVHQDAYLLLNARLALQSASKAISFGVGVENLTNNDVMTFTTDSTLFPGGYMGSQLTQRNYYFDVRYGW